MTGTGQGTVTMSYNTTCGSAATYVVTVVATPAAITGASNVCNGASTTLSNTATGGTWSTSNTAIATASTAGIITGVAGGTVTVTYNNGCGTPATALFTVVNPPLSVTGPSSLCVGSTITMSDTTTSGTWSTTNAALATVNAVTGVVTGIGAGAVNIIFSDGCNPTTYKTVTVTSAGPAAITGGINSCIGINTTLADATPGGTWNSSNTAIATISATGVLTAVGAGTTTVTYSIGCGTNSTLVFTVKAAPSVITGLARVCAGATIALTDSATGGTWSSSNNGIASVSTAGIVTGVAAGTVNIIYNNSCGTSATDAITVVAAPAVITGTANVCAGAQVTLADVTANGTWSSSNTAIATNAAGVVTGITGGVDTITYNTGCGTPATFTLTVKGSPSSITGPVTACVGANITLSDSLAGGTWSSSSAGHASVSTSTGVVTGVAAGTATISYTNGCGTATIGFTTISAPAAITGGTVVCTTASLTLADATAGGVWSSGNTAIATASGANITGVSAGTVTVSYSNGCGSPATYSITVKGAPSAITGGSPTLCVGSTMSLSDSLSGGTWSSSSPTHASVVASTGVVTGVGAGTANIIYTNGCGTATYAMATLAVPAAITGATSVCQGTDIILADAASGGTWSTSNMAIATNSGADVTGVAAGTVTVTYSTGCGSPANYNITVRGIPSLVAGASSVCIGSSITLSDSTTGGTWSSSNTARATVSTSGVVTGISAGSANIAYTTGCGSAATNVVTILGTPASITGSTAMYIGSTVSLADATANGTWTSGNTAVATISTTGVVTGVSAGTSPITYSTGCGPIATQTVTVAVGPAPITGTPTVCVGATVTLSDVTPGGTWSSTSTAHATVSAAGIVRGIAAGTASINYATSGGTVTYAITIPATPAAITGPAVVCVSADILLADATSGGVWSTSNAAVAVDSGADVTGVAAGTVTVTYSTGCGSPANYTVTVKGAPVNIVSPSGTVCVGSSITMSDSTLGGTWSSGTTGHASVVSTTGVVTGVGAGTANITYSNGCGTATYPITTLAAPAAITGLTTVCQGTDIILSDATAGGTWSTSNTAIATNSGSDITGISAGTVSVTYTTGCGTAASYSVTVKGIPSVITGGTTVCTGATVALSDSTAGGTWTSSYTPRATVSASTGVVTGIAAGVLTITYTTACGTAATNVMTVVATPAAITGTTNVCAGSDVILADATAGGTWSTSDPTIATVSTSGDVTGIAAGLATITYNTGCSSGSTTAFTVKGTPASIVGPSTLCVGSSVTLSNTTASGTWSSSNTGRATIVAGTGVVTGVSAGALTITYTTGCGSAATLALTIVPSPAAITGTTSVCPGAGTILADATSGGTWSTSNAAIATTGTSGVVTGIASGTVTVSYSNGCGTPATTVLTVKNLPSSVTGPATVCSGSVITLSDSASGGTWTSSNTARATVVAATGAVTGIAAGAVTLTYTTGCGIAATYPVTVMAAPAAITGTAVTCTGSSVTLADATAGGTWSTSSSPIATTSASGVVTGISSGTVTVSYSNGCGSPATIPFTVKTTPAAITGSVTVCAGSSITLSDGVAGGTWSSSTPAQATVVAATGVVTGISAGAVTLSYTTGCGTAATYPVTVKGVPVAITGTTTACTGTSTTLSDATAGGTWSSSVPSVATVNTTGTVTSITTGTTTITYGAAGCSASSPFTVQTAPASISGTSNVCTGAADTLYDITSGGAWSSASTSIATINSATGVIATLSAGSDVISYANGCGIATKTLTVQGAPSAISGATNLCIGGSSAYTDSLAGGTWSSGNTAIATINASTGTATGIAAGTTTIAYTFTNACGTNTVSQTLTISATGTWLGSYSTNWNDAGNWPCGAIPTGSVNVTIPSGTTYAPTLSANGYVKNLTVASGVTIIINSGDSLKVKGSLTNNGIIGGSGQLELNGSSAQVLYGVSNVGNVDIKNSTGVSVNTGDTLKVKGTLQLTLGTLTTNNGVQLASDSTATGRIGAITGGAISGNVIVQQYITGGRRAYRFWSHPFTSSIALSQLERYVDVTGSMGSANGFTTTTTNASSAYWYNTAIGNSSLGSDPGWTAFTSTNGIGANAVNQFEGFRIFVRGAKGEGLDGTAYTPSAVSVNMVGQVNTGAVSVTMVKGTGTAADYNLLGNPYPSPVDIGTVIHNAQTAGKIAGSAFYVWNPYMGTSGQFMTVPIGSAYSIEGNASFEVRTAANGNTLNFAENNKTATYGTVLLRESNTEYVSLNIYDTAYHLWDMMYLQFNADATDADDNMYDGRKPSSPASLNFYSWSSDNQKLSLDSRPYSAGKAIPLGIRSAYAQDFIIKADNVVGLKNNAELYLVDKYLNQSVQIAEGTEYKFRITADSLSQGDKRFELRMGSTDNTVAQIAGIDAKLTPNPATDEVSIAYSINGKEKVMLRLIDASGIMVASQDLGTQQSGNAKVSLKNLASGVYLVELTSGNQKLVQRLVKE
jgi:uncharacterized protein YjdB